MATSVFASLPEQFNLADFTLTATTGGSTTVSTSHYYFCYGLSRGGINLARSMGQVAVTSGEKLQFQINASASPSGISPFGYVLGAAATNDPTAAKILAVAWAIDSDQETARSLPLTLELTKDSDFVLSGVVSTAANLPATPVNGCVRFVTDESKYYEYDAEGWYNEGTPFWRQVYGDDLYLSTTSTIRSGIKWRGGCNVPINSFVITANETASFYGLITPPWTGDGSESTPVKIWLLNGLSEGGGQTLVQGGRVSAVVTVNGDTDLAAAHLGGQLTFTATQVIRRSDGTQDSALSGDFIWASNPFYTLPSAISPGYALEFSVVTTAVVGDGDRVGFYLRYDGELGSYSDASIVGDVVYSSPATKARIVPNTNGVKRLPGSGLILTSGQLHGYQFSTTQEITITQGIVADTADQQLAISGVDNGSITVYQNGVTLPATKKLRAVLSTEAGTATASSWSSAVTVGTNGRIEFTVTLPTAIRNDYPDTSINGNTDAVRQIPQARVFVRLSGTIYEAAAEVIGAGANQIIIVDDLTGLSTVGSLPSNADPDFNLWGYGSIVGVSSGVGALAAGDYELAIAWHYPSPNLAPTKISHKTSDGCIPENSLPIATAINYAGNFANIQIEGVDQTARAKLDFNSRLVTGTDDPTNDRLRLGLEVARTVLLNRAPNASDDDTQGYLVGDRIADISGSPSIVYYCQDNSTGAAVWTAIGTGGVGGSGIAVAANLAALKAVSSPAADAAYILKVNATSGLDNCLYRYDSGSTATADDNVVILPDSGTGRWLKVGEYDTDEHTAGGDFLYVTASEKAAIGNLPADTVTALAAKEASLGNPAGNNYILERDSDGITRWVVKPTAGVAGWNAYATSSQSFVIPTGATTRTVTLASGSTAGWVIGQALTFGDGSVIAYMEVTDIPSSSQITVKALPGASNPTGTMNGGASVNGLKITSGSRGQDGWDAYGTSSQSLAIPDSVTTRTITLATGTTEGWTAGHILSFTDGTLTAYLKVTAVTNSTQFDVIGLTDRGNPAGTLNAGLTASGIKILTGDRGPQGPTGSVSAASGLILDSGSAPSTSATQWALYYDGIDLQLRQESDGASDRLLNETQIEAKAETFKVSANDTTPGYLNGKLTKPSDSGIKIEEINDASNETLEISIDIASLTADPSPAGTEDYAITLDHNGGSPVLKKVLLNNLPSTGGGGANVIISSATAPTQRDDTTALQDKDIWSESDTDLLYVYRSNAWHQVTITEADVPQSFTSQRYFTQATLTDGATISWNLNTAQTAKVTLAGNRTLNNPTNKQAGATYLLLVVQDATGGRTLTFSSDYKFPGGTAPTLSTGANQIDLLTFYCDGTNMYGVSALNFS